MRATILRRSASASAIAFVALASGQEAFAQGGADEIIVTATRQETALSKTPIALSAITGEGLRDSGVTNPTTLGEVVPNLSIDRANGLQITIRGVTSTDGTEKGDPSAAFMLDGVYIARPQVQEVSFFDLERVEVLRGPQGTLWGRNTTAGAINIISAKPKHEFEASFDAAYGSYNTVQTTGMVNVPVNDAVALRAAVNYDRRDNFLDTTSSTSIDPFKDNLSARLSALFDISDSVEVVVRADYAQMKGHTDNSLPVTNFFEAPFVADVDPDYFDSPAEEQLTSTFPVPWETGRDNSTWGVMAEANMDLGGGFSLAYVGSYREFTRDERGTVFAGANRTTFNGDYWQNSQELRLAFGSGERLHGQIGAYYFKERSGIEFFILDPQNLGFPPVATQFGFPQDPTIAESYAFFGQATYDLTDALHLTAGVRYSHDYKSRVGATVFDLADGTRINLQINDAARNFSKTTWRAGLDYDIPGLGLAYFTASTGYKAGGFNDGCEDVDGDPATDPVCGLPAAALFYQPETLTAYEGGFKFGFFDGVLNVNGALFHYDYKGLQLSQASNACGGPCQITTNAASSKVDGIELDATIRPGERHRFDFAATWLDARYAEYFPVPTVSFEGKSLDRSPEFTVAAGYAYEHPLPNGGVLEAGVRTKYSDEYMLTDLVLRGQFRQPSFHKTDLTLTYHAPDDRWYLQGFAKNLENEITLSTATVQAGGAVSVQDPRTYGARLGARF